VHSDVALIFLTRHPDHRTAGIDVDDIPARAGYLRKDLVGDLRALTSAIDAVLRERPSEHRHDRSMPDHPLRALTSRQIEALRLAALGLSNAAIARARGTSERAVEKTLQAALQTLGVPDDPDLNRRVEGIRRFIATAGLPAREDRAVRDSADREDVA
jgi:DNA-binding NarL/FixJ family response regulator